MEKLTQREWLDYVNRLQDRERQKISSGGLNNWVLFGAIGGLGYWIYPEIQLIMSNLNRLVLSIAIFLNISLSVFNVFNREFRRHKVINFRITKNVPIIEKITRKIMKFYELSVGILSTLINFLAIYFNHNTRADILITLIFFTLINLLGFYGMFYRGFNLPHQKIEDNIVDNEFGLFKRIVSSVGIYVSVYPLIAIYTSMNFSKLNLQIDLFGIVFVLIVILFQLLMAIFTKRLKIAWLEEFEREIISKELSDFEIRSKLKETYFKLSNVDDYF